MEFFPKKVGPSKQGSGFGVSALTISSIVRSRGQALGNLASGTGTGQLKGDAVRRIWGLNSQRGLWYFLVQAKRPFEIPIPKSFDRGLHDSLSN